MGISIKLQTPCILNNSWPTQNRLHRFVLFVCFIFGFCFEFFREKKVKTRISVISTKERALGMEEYDQNIVYKKRLFKIFFEKYMSKNLRKGTGRKKRNHLCEVAYIKYFFLILGRKSS